MNSIVGLEWPVKNSQRNYPFFDSANLIIGEIGFLPNDLIVDARIYMRGAYQAKSTPYISKIDIQFDKAVIDISVDDSYVGSVQIPWIIPIEESQGALSAGANPTDSFKLVSLPIMRDGISNGILVVNFASMYVLQSVGMGSYSFDADSLRFLPFVCEYLPGPQVVSVNGLNGTVLLRGESGIKVDRVNNTDIKISIVGDPHFTRHNCVSNTINDSLSSFLEQLVVLHYRKNSNGSLTPQKSILKVRNDNQRRDGSVDFHLQINDNLERDNRQAFRITVKDNTITLSMAGA